VATRSKKGDPIRYRQTKSGPRWDVFYDGKGEVSNPTAEWLYPKCGV
jgi:hypothetical protein